MRNFALVLIAVALLTSCEKQNPVQNPPKPDSIIADSAPPLPNKDSVRRVIDSLEKQLANSDSSQHASLLYELGRAKHVLSPEYNSPHVEYAKARPDEFSYFEPGAQWFYMGNDYKELLRRFPNHELAADAAYALTLIGDVSGCESELACNIEITTDRLWPFLTTYKSSPYTDEAVDRVLEVYRRFDDIKDLKASEFNYEPADGPRLIAELDSVARLLPPPHRDRLIERAAELRRRL